MKMTWLKKKINTLRSTFIAHARLSQYTLDKYGKPIL